MKRSLLLAVAVSIMMGCSPIQVHLYDGPQRPEDQVAKLDIQVSDQTVLIDGRRLPQVGSELSIAFRGKRYRILPGPHTIEIASSSVLHPKGKNLILTFDAQAGYKYTLDEKAVCLLGLEDGDKALYYPKWLARVTDDNSAPVSKNNLDFEYIVPIYSGRTMNAFKGIPSKKCAVLQGTTCHLIIDGTTYEGTKIRFNLRDSLLSLPAGRYVMGIEPSQIPGYLNLKTKPMFVPLLVLAGHEYEIGFRYFEVDRKSGSLFGSDKVQMMWFPQVKDITTGAIITAPQKNASSFYIETAEKQTVSFGNSSSYYSINYDQDGVLQDGAPYIVTSGQNRRVTGIASLGDGEAATQFAPGLKILGDASLFPEKILQAVKEVLANQEEGCTVFFEPDRPQPGLDSITARHGKPDTKSKSNKWEIIPEGMTINYFGKIGFATKNDDVERRVRWIVIN